MSYKVSCILIGVFMILSRNGEATNYYVNDGTLDGDDVYTTAVGAIGNTGLAPNSPKALPSQVIALGGLVGGDTIFIDAGNFTDELLIDGINGSVGNYIVFRGVDSTKTTITGVAGTNGAAPVAPRELVIQVHNSDYISIENLRLNESAGNDWVIQFYNGSSNNIVRDVYINGYYGIDIEAGANTFNEIDGCYIKAQYVGVRLKNGADDNHVHDCAIIIDEASFFAAIEIQSASDNLIERCVISTTGNASEATIHGGKWSTGNKFYNNYILNHTAGELAIDSDFGDQIDLVHNSIYSAGNGINYEHITPGDHVVDLTLESNIIYAAGGYPIILPDVSDKFTLMDNNLYFSSTGDVAEIGGTGYDLAAWKTFDPDGAGAGSATNSIYGNPGFADVSGNDLSIGTTSPAYNAATNARAFGLDVFQSIRPFGGVRDIGAYEFNTLPIELVFFNAGCGENQSVDLNWMTLSESNNDYFTIEAGNDQDDLLNLATVIGAGNSSDPLLYTYKATGGKNYFRLKQTDFDGSVTYSEVIYVDCELNKLQLSYIADHTISVVLPNDDRSLDLQMWSVNGQLLFKTVMNNLGQYAEIRLPNISSGVYVVTAASESSLASLKFRF